MHQIENLLKANPNITSITLDYEYFPILSQKRTRPNPVYPPASKIPSSPFPFPPRQPSKNAPPNDRTEAHLPRSQ